MTLEAKMFYTCGPNEAMVVSGKILLVSISYIYKTFILYYVISCYVALQSLVVKLRLSCTDEIKVNKFLLPVSCGVVDYL